MIRDKCKNNELMDIKSIGLPDLVDEVGLDIYVFAGFVKRRV